MNKLDAFITRKIAFDSPLNEVKEKVNLTGHSLIKFEPLTFDPQILTAWVFFYSSNGVRFYLQELRNKDFLRDVKVATMGKGTSATFTKLMGRDPDFIGNGTKEYAILFCNNLGETITFVKGNNSLSSVEQGLIEADHKSLVVYNNEPDYKVPIPDADIYIVTSPLNAQVFERKGKFRPNVKVVAIGKTTKDKLLELGYSEVLVPEFPYETSLVNLLNTMIHE